MSTATRPTTCGGMFAVDPALGSKGCKRLPRHGGEHRGFLTAAAARRATKVTKVTKAPTKKAAPKGQKTTKVALNSLVRDIRAQVGQPRGRLNAAKRRLAIGLVVAAVDAGVITAGDGLGLSAKF